ncbi:Uncharacterised protein [Candidatus Gugararchaeum adminiculabundum]|nr:Uncharacterised protein [Candidatus Gugararchaeum adminiculabundum]
MLVAHKILGPMRPTVERKVECQILAHVLPDPRVNLMRMGGILYLGRFSRDGFLTAPLGKVVKTYAKNYDESPGRYKVFAHFADFTLPIGRTNSVLRRENDSVYNAGNEIHILEPVSAKTERKLMRKFGANTLPSHIADFFFEQLTQFQLALSQR